MKSARSLSSIPENMDDIPEINQAFEIANQANLTPAEREDLDRREMFIYDQQGAVALGREEGRKQGMEEEKLAIARKLLPILDDEAIAQTTGLSLAEVKALRN